MSSESYNKKNWEQLTKEEKEEFLHHMYHSRTRPLTEKETLKLDSLIEEMQNDGSKVIYFSTPLRLSDMPPFNQIRMASTVMTTRFNFPIHQRQDLVRGRSIRDYSSVNSAIKKADNVNSKLAGHRSSAH